MAVDKCIDIMQFLLFGSAASHRKTQVGTVETADECLAIQVQLLHDVLSCYLVGSGCKGNDGHMGEMLSDGSQLRVLGSEIVSPLADAVGLIDGK